MAQMKEIEGGAPSNFNEEEREQKQDSFSMNDCDNKINASSAILCITQTNELRKYLQSLNELSSDVENDILSLCEWIKSEKGLSIKICQNIKMSELILAYFSSFSKTNPGKFG